MNKTHDLDDIWSRHIKSSLEGMDFGTVHIIVHGGKIVQIERTERKRFDADSKHSGQHTVKNIRSKG